MDYRVGLSLLLVDSTVKLIEHAQAAAYINNHHHLLACSRTASADLVAFLVALMDAEKTVLIMKEEHRRPVSFSSASASGRESRDYAILVHLAKEIFNIEESTKVFLQVKNDDWGEF